jgi:predicted dehydrogenase
MKSKSIFATVRPRRDFLKTAAITVSLPYLVPSTVLGLPGPNDRVRVGLIGAGYRSRDLTVESPADLKLVALADCDRRQMAAYLAAVQKRGNKILAGNVSQYQDYRLMFSKEKLDAVFVATTTHARALICLHAMQAGLDVYAEKPLTLTIEEGQYLLWAEKKYHRVVQVGTQQRSIAINNFGSDLVRNGALGKIHTVVCPNFIGPERRGTLPVQPVSKANRLRSRPRRKGYELPEVI